MYLTSDARMYINEMIKESRIKNDINELMNQYVHTPAYTCMVVAMMNRKHVYVCMHTCRHACM